MARTPRPWYRSERDEWRVRIRGVDYNLGPHPEGHPTPRKQRGRWNAPQPILDSFHTLLATPAAPPIPAPPRCPSVGEVFDKFLEWCQQKKAPRTYEWYKGHIQDFCDALKARPQQLRPSRLPADQLRPFHVSEWVDGHATWGSNQKRGAIVAVTRPFNWAAKQGYLDASPVRGVEKPEAVKRASRLTPEHFAELIALVRDRPFRDLLEFSYEVGCRPQEARHVERRHVRLDLHRIEIPPEEAKGKRRWRVIYLSDKAEEIVRRLLADSPDGGKLFLNLHGNPWKVHAVNCRFGRLKAKLGVRFAAYDLRHCFATRKLKEGRDPITVATLLGHKDASMLCKHYEELSRDGEHLRDAVNGTRAN
jgi:integrase